MRILIVGSGTREHCIARKLNQSTHTPILFCIGSHKNPGLIETTEEVYIGDITDPKAVTTYAKEKKIDLAIIGPEAPLAAGVADALRDMDIPTVGPRQLVAQLETSKAFTRNLVAACYPQANPACKYFSSLEGVEDFVQEKCHGSFVIKHDGLKGGKGVMVMDDHFIDLEESLVICEEIISMGESFLIEEKLFGEEFSLFSINDGKHLAHSIAIQDHKRAYEGDSGPNTGGMGTYSDVNHSLPFLTPADIDEAKHINTKVAQELKKQYDVPYQGIMYGGFMVTKYGVKLIEYNARLGDPEVFNLLTLMKSDLVDLCIHITQQTLNTFALEFLPQASVCKYIVPQGYPQQPIKGGTINIDKQNMQDVDCFFGSVEQVGKDYITLGSRAIAIIAHGNDLNEAEQKVEKAIQHISGPISYRKDIGTQKSMNEKINIMNRLRK